MTLTREQVGWRCAQDIRDGWHVNLGIGMPELCANAIPEGREILFHSENGILGMGPSPAAEDIDPNLINAGKRPITMLPGAAIFDHAMSFAIVRGRHLDLCVLGAYQLAANGDIANWARSREDVLPAIGGAMDLAAGARRIWSVTTHVNRDGSPKLMETCSYPLTGAAVVSRIFTDMAVIEVDEDGFLVREIAPGVSRAELEDKTAAPLRYAEECREIAAPELAPAPEKIETRA